MNPWTDPMVATHTPMTMVVASLLLSFVLGQLIAWLYSITHRGMTWSRNMVHSIVMLSMIVTGVMLVVGDSIARAFGLVGALAIIRFRTVVRDARDTTFIFLALAVGIAVGAHQPTIAVVATLIVGTVAMVLHYTQFGSRYVDAGVLRVRTTGGMPALEQLIGEWCTFYKLLKERPVQGEEIEYSFEVRLYNPQEREAFEAAFKAIGVTQVALHIEEKAEEW